MKWAKSRKLSTPVFRVALVILATIGIVLYDTISIFVRKVEAKRQYNLVIEELRSLFAKIQGVACVSLDI